jgi:hypothetical protein
MTVESTPAAEPVNVSVPPAPPTLMEALQAKREAAKLGLEHAQTEFAALEAEIAAIPAHLHQLTLEDLWTKVKTWFA